MATLNELAAQSPGIDIEATNGGLPLSGFVACQADINKAVAVAWGVNGAKSLKLDVRGNRRQIDGEVRQRPVH